MSTIIVILYLVLFSFFFILALSFYQKKRYTYAIVCLSLLLKFVLVLFLESGLKYYVAADGMKYESDAWTLNKAIESNVAYILEDFERLNAINPFTRLSMFIFDIFGKHASIIILINIAASILCYFLCLKIFDLFWTSEVKSEPWFKRARIFLLAIVCFYPTFHVWSTTVTKDPFATLFSLFGIYMLLLMMSDVSVLLRPMFFLLSLLSIYFSGQFRAYLSVLIFTGLLLGVALYFIQKAVGLWKSIFILFFIGTFSLLTLQIFMTEEFIWLGQTIQDIRYSFLNMADPDIVAVSGFLVNYSFESTFDYLLFIPQAAGRYFFGPFIWEISSTAEGLGLIEAFMMILLVKPFFVGLKRLMSVSQFNTSILLGVIFSATLMQSFLVGNLGTIFRHRSICFFLIFIIAAGGYGYGNKKKAI